MKLSDKQQKFTVMIGKLIQFAHSARLCLTFGERTARQNRQKLNAQKGSGMPNSLHCSGWPWILICLLTVNIRPAQRAYRRAGRVLGIPWWRMGRSF